MIATATDDLVNIIWSSTTLGASIFALCAVLLRRFKTPSPALYLDAAAVFLAFQTCDMLDDLLFDPPFAAPEALDGWFDLLVPIAMISIWFFVRGLTEPAVHLRRRDLWHLIPLFIGALFLAPGLSLPPETRAILEDSPIPLSGRALWASWGGIGFWAGWVVMLIGYGFACAYRLRQHKRNIRALFSDLEGKTLWWLDALVAVILLLAWFVIIDEALSLAGSDDILNDWSEGAHGMALSLLIGLFALHVTPPLPDWSAEILRPDTAPDPTPVITEPAAPSQDQAAPAPRYARSGLGPEDLERLAARLEKRMREGKLWQDPMLNLKTLSEATGIQTMHLSEVLNTQLGQSFFDYVNGQRIDEACQRLGSSTETVLEISEAVGFNSKSTFNANFKRITGKTPTAWRAAMKAMLPEDRVAS